MRNLAIGRRSGAILAYRAALLGAVVTSSLGACSLQRLDQLPYTPCGDSEAAACEALNATIAEGTCERWVCVNDLCRIRRAGMFSETCDGTDEDCDGLIDEEGSPIVPHPVDDVSVRAPLLALVPEPDGAIVATFDEGIGTRFDVANATGVAWTQQTLGLRVRDTAEPEPLPCGDASEPTECEVFDAASTHLAGALLVATFAGLDADEALLRVGHRAPGATDEFVWLVGPSGHSSSWRGIAPASGGRGGSLVIAAMPPASGQVPQALVAFVAHGREDVVELVGVWLDGEGTERAVHATPPLELTARPRAGLGRPALTAVSGAPRGAYLIAYPTDDGVALAALPALPEPEPRCELLGCARASLPLERPDEVILADTAPLGDVAIAASAGRREILLGLREGDEVVLVPGDFEPGSPSVPLDTHVSLDPAAAERIAAPGAADLSLVRVAGGLSLRASEPREGGYLLAFHDSESTYVGRRADLIGRTSLATLGPASSHPVGRELAGELSVIGGQADGLVEFPRACGTRR